MRHLLLLIAALIFLSPLGRAEIKPAIKMDLSPEKQAIVQDDFVALKTFAFDLESEEKRWVKDIFGGDSGADVKIAGTAQRAAASVGAAHYIRGRVSLLRDGLRIDALMASTVDNRTVQNAAVRLVPGGGQLDSVFNALADSLLLGAEEIDGTIAKSSTRSLDAIRGFGRAQRAIREWLPRCSPKLPRGSCPANGSRAGRGN